MRALLVALAPVLAAAFSWELRNPVTTIDSFITAAFGQNTVVAFTPNRIFTAPSDSKSFTQIPYSINGSGYDLTWIDSCFWANQSLFIGIGHFTSTAGQLTLMVTTSPDAKNWRISNEFTLQWKFPSIACGHNEIFLSTGVSVFQSTDGRMWRTKTPLVSFDQMSYIADVGYYVAWSHALQTVFTSDIKREVWDIHVGPPKFPFSNIVYGRGVWVIGGAGVVYWSTNLAGWSVGDIPLNYYSRFSGLSFSSSAQVFVLTAHNGSGLYLYQSTDGAAWNLRLTLPTTNEISLTISSTNVTYALGETGLVIFTRDTITWELLSGDWWGEVVWAVWDQGVWWAPSTTKDYWEDVTVPMYNTIDGEHWTRYQLNASDVVLTFTGPPVRSAKTQTWLAVTSQAIWRSSDLLTWTDMFDGWFENLQGFNSLYWDPTGAIAVVAASGPRMDELWKSIDDGHTWSRIVMQPSQLTKLHRTLVLSSTVFLNCQSDSHGVWFFVSRDTGVTWTNTSARVAQIENDWLLTSKAVLHIGTPNVTVASLNDLTTWTTQQAVVRSTAIWVVFQDNFVAVDRNQTWTSSDGLTWTLTANPYYVAALKSFATSDKELLGLGNGGIAGSAQ